MSRGDKNYGTVVRKHNKGKTKSKARIAAVHQMVEAMIQNNNAAASDAFKTYLQITSREILGEDADEMEDEMTADDDSEEDDSEEDFDDEESDDDDMDGDDEESEESDMDDDDEAELADDDEVVAEGKKGVNPFADKGKDKKKEQKETTSGKKSKKMPKVDAKNARPSRGTRKK